MSGRRNRYPASICSFVVLPRSRIRLESRTGAQVRRRDGEATTTRSAEPEQLLQEQRKRRDRKSLSQSGKRVTGASDQKAKQKSPSLLFLAEESEKETGIKFQIEDRPQDRRWRRTGCVVVVSVGRVSRTQKTPLMMSSSCVWSADPPESASRSEVPFAFTFKLKRHSGSAANHRPEEPLLLSRSSSQVITFRTLLIL